MPINPDAVGSKGDPVSHSWTSRDSLLYALGVGAGLDDLEFTTENTNGVTQQALPTMGVVVGVGGFGALADIGTFNPILLVHGGQSIELHGEIPVEGTVSTVGELTAIWDKGSGAVVELTSVSTLEGTSEPLFTQVSQIFLRGEGGWGGERGPSGPRNVAPERAPDHEVTYSTRPDQALLYRLSGDRNPLHSDPSFAKMAGFDRPILHGLCTYGFTGRALLQELCARDVTKFASMDARFSSPVFPGEDLTVRIWRTSDGEAVFRTHGGDDRVVLDAGLARYRG